jgi:two-component system response regulator FixJ
MPEYASIYLVDGDRSSRRMLAPRLDRRGFEVWPFDSVDRFLAVVDTLRPSCILLDIDGGRRIDLISRLRERTGGWPIIALDADPDIATAVDAMRAGAVDFLDKVRDSARLDLALRNACAALREMQEEARDRQDALTRLARLTPREKEVAASVLNGLGNKRTAHRLGISVRTVEMHRSHLIAKLGVRNMAEAAVLLARLGFGEAREPMAGARWVGRGGSESDSLTFAA